MKLKVCVGFQVFKKKSDVLKRLESNQNKSQFGRLKTVIVGGGLDSSPARWCPRVLKHRDQVPPLLAVTSVHWQPSWLLRVHRMSTLEICRCKVKRKATGGNRAVSTNFILHQQNHASGKQPESLMCSSKELSFDGFRNFQGASYNLQVKNQSYVPGHQESPVPDT